MCLRLYNIVQNCSKWSKMVQNNPKFISSIFFKWVQHNQCLVQVSDPLRKICIHRFLTLCVHRSAQWCWVSCKCLSDPLYFVLCTFYFGQWHGWPTPDSKMQRIVEWKVESDPDDCHSLYGQVELRHCTLQAAYVHCTLQAVYSHTETSDPSETIR